MVSKVDELYFAILSKQETLSECSRLFGSGHIMTTRALHELAGMEEAFKIITGMNAVEYMIQQMEK